MRMFRRTLRPTTNTIVYVEFNPDSGRLSLSGTARGKMGGSGQVLEQVREGVPAEGWRKRDCYELYKCWKRWHLNDLRAGTPKQEEAVREWKKKNQYDYKLVCDYLKTIGLYEDNGYRYGTAWLKEEVPKEVIEWLYSLPGVGADVDDVYPSEVTDQELFSIIF